MTLSGPITNNKTLGVTKDGNSTYLLSGTNTFSGGLMINNGALRTMDGAEGNGTVTVNSGGIWGLDENYNPTAKLAVGSSGILALNSNNSTLTGVNGSSVFIGSLGNYTFTGSSLVAGSGSTYRLGGGGGTLTITGTNVITGANSLIIGSTQNSGTGVVVLTGSNNYSGGTTIAAGILQVGNGGVTGSINGNVTDNAALVYNRSNAVAVSGTISGSGSLTQAGAGVLTLSASNSYSGGTTLVDGTINFVNGGLGSSGTISFTGGGGTLKYAAGNTQDLSGRIASSSAAVAIDTGTNSVSFLNPLGSTNTGGLTKSGTGKLTLTGSNGYTGETKVTAGELIVSGSLYGTTTVTVSDSVLTVKGLINFLAQLRMKSGGFLSGYGSVGPVVMSGGGTVAPSGSGGSTGTLNINGNLTFDPLGGAGPAHFAMQLSGTIAGTGYDQISMAPGSTLDLSNVNLDGSLLNGYVPTHFATPAVFTGDTFYLVIGAGGVSGTFANRQAATAYSNGFDIIVFNSQAFAISYTANYNSGSGSIFSSVGGHDIALMAIPEPETWAMFASGFGLLIFGQRLRRCRRGFSC